MSKPLDYYAGYPGQQATPKWVGVAIGSLFGGMFLIALAVAIKLVIPTRTAEASVVRPVIAPATAVVPAPVLAPVAPAPVEVASLTPAPAQHFSRHHGHSSKKAAAPVAQNAKYNKAQLFAKSVSRRDKKSRDDLDKMLGL